MEANQSLNRLAEDNSDKSMLNLKPIFKYSLSNQNLLDLMKDTTDHQQIQFGLVFYYYYYYYNYIRKI
jgi:hypothetical protein